MTETGFVPNDTELPGLAALFAQAGAPDHVLEAAHGLTGRIASGAVERTYTRYWPHRRCVVQWTYDMPAGEEPLIVSAELLSRREFERGREGVGALLGEHKTWVQVFPHDRVLPGIATAVDHAWVRDTLAPALGLEGASIKTKAVSYKSWRRCVIEYEIDGRCVYGKLFRDDRGAELAERLAALDEAMARAGLPWSVAKTVMYDAGLKMLVQEALPEGYTLSELLPKAPDDEAARSELLPAVRDAAKALPKLQTVELAGMETFSAKDAYASLADDIEDIAKVDAEAGEMLREGLSNIDKLMRGLEPEPLVTAHSAFRHSHVYRTAEGQALLDLDNLRLCGVNADAGYFAGYLEYSMIRRSRLRDVLRESRDAFLDEWSQQPGYHPLWHAFHTQHVLLKWAIRSFFSLDEDWRRIVERAGFRVKELRKEARAGQRAEMNDPLLELAGNKRRLRKVATEVVAPALWPGCEVESVDVEVTYTPGEEAVALVRLGFADGPARRAERLVMTVKAPQYFEDTCLEAQDFADAGFWVSPKRDYFVEVFPRDYMLPGLQKALDGERVQALLSRAGILPRVEEISSFEADVLRYRPHQRCVVRYTATLRNGETRRVVAKVYEDPATAREVWTMLRALRNQLPDPVLVVKPLLLDLDAAMVFMENIEGEPVGDLMEATPDAPGVRRYIEMTAKALAGLHALTLDHDRVKTFATEIEKLRVHERESGAVSEELGNALNAALNAIEVRGAALPLLAPGFVHGGFKPTQMLLRPNGEVTVVDFDGSCIGDMTIDVGRFMAKTRVEGMDAEKPVMAGMDAYFLDRYIEYSGRDIRDRARIYQALSLVRMASRRFETRAGSFERGGLESGPSGVLLREAMTCLGMA